MCIEIMLLNDIDIQILIRVRFILKNVICIQSIELYTMQWIKNILSLYKLKLKTHIYYCSYRYI